MQRLQTRAQFEAVLKGPILAKTAHFAIHAQHLPLPGRGEAALDPQQAALGAMVPKRWAKRAVTRNLLKRQIYALSHHLLQSGTPRAFVVRLRQSFSRQQFSAAASEQLKQAACLQLLSLYAKASEASA
ncbi:MAG: ribonuclease P protein component [Betaproteobacteria bacterium]